MASPVDTSVKFFNESMPGAPVLNGVAGALIALLDACLITGFGLRACTITVASGVATVTVASDVKNLNLADSVQLIAGVTGGPTNFADLNGEQKVRPSVTEPTSTAFKFNCPTVGDGTATGTITVKQAPVGYWEKTYSTTNVACYRSTHPLTLGAFLRVDDTGTTQASVRMYETMSAHSTGTNQAPTTSDATNTFWTKSTASNATANGWDFFADSRRMIYAPLAGTVGSTTYISQSSFFFGDINSYKSVDPFAVFLSTTSSAASTYGSVMHSQQGGVSQGPTRILRSYTGLGAAIQSYAISLSGSASGISGLDNTWGMFPSVDGKLRMNRMLVVENATSGASVVLRGLIPGVWYLPTSGAGPLFPRGTRVVNESRNLYSVRQASSSYSETTQTAGLGFVDVTGPW